MKKAVIVIDMPKNCDECRFNYDMGIRCDALDDGAEHNTKDMRGEVRPHWCPLRPLPDKWERRMEKYVQECHQVQEHIREND